MATGLIRTSLFLLDILCFPFAEMKEKAMEPLRSTFSRECERGGVIVAGKNFGCGWSREQAAAVLKELGIGEPWSAESFARLFFRDAVNVGIPVVEAAGICGLAQEGDVRRDRIIHQAQCDWQSEGWRFGGVTLPDFLLEIIEAGGLVPHISKE